MSDSVQYQASFPVDLVDDAGRRFTRYVYQRMFGWKIGVLWLVNVAACVLAVALSGWTTATTTLCALIGVASLYFVANYVARPGVTARRLLRAFGNGATVTLRPDGFDLETRAGKMSRPWARHRAILEQDAYFLLVVLPTIGLVLPKAGMPEPGLAWARAAARGPMTRGRFPGM